MVGIYMLPAIYDWKGPIGICNIKVYDWVQRAMINQRFCYLVRILKVTPFSSLGFFIPCKPATYISIYLFCLELKCSEKRLDPYAHISSSNSSFNSILSTRRDAPLLAHNCIHAISHAYYCSTQNIWTLFRQHAEIYFFFLFWFLKSNMARMRDLNLSFKIT